MALAPPQCDPVPVSAVEAPETVHRGGSETPTTVSEDVVMEEAPAQEETPKDTTLPRLNLTMPLPVSKAPFQATGPAPPEATKTRSSRYRGVCWNKKNKRWQSAINNSGKYIYLGSYTSDIEAARAFDLAALQIRGRNTKLNFSVEDYPENQWKEGAPPHLVEKYTSGAIRSKPTPFRQFTGTPLKKLLPSNYATIQVPVRRGRFEETPFGKRNFQKAEQRFLSSAFISAAVTGTPKIKQEFPQAPMAPDPTLSRKSEVIGSPFEKSFLFCPSGISPASVQIGRSFTPSITTPQFQRSGKEVIDQKVDYKTRAPLDTSGKYDPLDDSAEQRAGFRPSAMTTQKKPVPQFPRNACLSDRLPVPMLQTSQDDQALHVSSVISETVAGSEIEEAKVIVGSSRNQFGLIHRTAHKSQWNALVYDGTTMHSMGVYASEDDAQVASSSAVRLVETIMKRSA